MKKLATVLSAALALSLLASPTFASNASPKGKGEICHEKSHDDACSNAHKPKKAEKPKKADKPKKVDKPKQAHKVPEIDAANAALALALMGGIVALRRERRVR